MRDPLTRTLALILTLLFGIALGLEGGIRVENNRLFNQLEKIEANGGVRLYVYHATSDPANFEFCAQAGGEINRESFDKGLQCLVHWMPGEQVRAMFPER